MTEQIGTEFRWNKTRNDAALLLAEDALSDTAIAEKVGVGRTTLHTWKQHPDFQARIKEHVAELEASVLRYAIAKKRNRVARQNADWERLEKIREERAGNPMLGGVPGDETGLLIRQYKMIGGGQNAQVIEEIIVDTAFVKSRNELEKHAASEVGDDPPVKVRHGGDADAPPIKTQSNVMLYIPANGREEPDDGNDPAEDDAASG